MSSTKTAQWYVKVKDKTHGPFTSGQLKKLAQKSQVQPDTPLRRGEEGKWSRAGKVKGLFPATSDATPKDSKATKDSDTPSSSQSAAAASPQIAPAEPQVIEPQVIEPQVEEVGVDELEVMDFEETDLEVMDVDVMDLEVMDAEVGGLDDVQLEPEGDDVWAEAAAANPYAAEDQRCPNCNSSVSTQLSICPQCACNLRTGEVPVESTRRRRPDDVPTVVNVYSHVLRWLYVLGGGIGVFQSLFVGTAALAAGEGVAAFVCLGIIAVQCLVTLVLWRLAVALDEGNAWAVIGLAILGSLVLFSAVALIGMGATGYGFGMLATFAIFYAPPLFSAFTNWGAFVFPKE